MRRGTGILAQDEDHVAARVLRQPAGGGERLKHAGVALDRHVPGMHHLADDRHGRRLKLVHRDGHVRRVDEVLEAGLDLARDRHRLLSDDGDVAEERHRDLPVAPHLGVRGHGVLPVDVNAQHVARGDDVVGGSRLLRRKLGRPDERTGRAATRQGNHDDREPSQTFDRGQDSSGRYREPRGIRNPREARTGASRPGAPPKASPSAAGHRRRWPARSRALRRSRSVPARTAARARA